MTVAFDGVTVIVETVETAAPDCVPVLGVNINGWLVAAVVATTFTFVDVVAKPVNVPVTFPVTLPVNGPANALAVTVPVEGVTVTVETLDTAAPDCVPELGVNIRGCAVPAAAATILTLVDVVAKPVNVPVTFPVTFPVNGPEKALAVIVPVEGVIVTVDIVETAAPD